MEFQGGSLGLYKYRVEEAEKCEIYSGEAEDSQIQSTRATAILALVFGFGFVIVGAFRQRGYRFNMSKQAMDVFAAAIQMYMSLVYLVWRNELCQTYGCVWGQGGIYCVTAQLCYLMATVSINLTASTKNTRSHKRDKSMSESTNLSSLIMPALDQSPVSPRYQNIPRDTYA